jgi:hypothetical protein
MGNSLVSNIENEKGEEKQDGRGAMAAKERMMPSPQDQDSAYCLQDVAGPAPVLRDPWDKAPVSTMSITSALSRCFWSSTSFISSSRLSQGLRP